MPKASHPSYLEVLNRVVDHYRSMCISGKWLGTNASEHGSTFKAGTENKSEWRPPTNEDKISNDPVRYQRTIKGKQMSWCTKCFDKRMGKKGTHFTDSHTGRPPSDNDNTTTSNTTSALNATDTIDEYAGSSTTSSATTSNTNNRQNQQGGRQVSFADALRNATGTSN